MTFIKKGVVVPLGTGTDFDREHIYQHTIIKHNGRFLLYYAGNDASHYRIGLATSKDGVTFIKKGVVVPLGTGTDFDVENHYEQSVIKHNGRFLLYYAGFDGSSARIGLATSKGGVTFVKKGVVIPLGTGTDFDICETFGPEVIKHNGRFLLYYTGYDGSNYRIGLATSKDGVTFVKKGVVIPLGTGTDFDATHIFEQSVIKHNGRFLLYYTGSNGSNYRIGLATSKDGVTFIKKGVVVPLGTGTDFDTTHAVGPKIIKHNGRFFLYYDGFDGSIYRLGLAISEDGL